MFCMLHIHERGHLPTRLPCSVSQCEQAAEQHWPRGNCGTAMLHDALVSVLVGVLITTFSASKTQSNAQIHVCLHACGHGT